MQVSVDENLCQSFGRCNTVDPRLFPLDEDGYSDIGQNKPVPAGQEVPAEQGVEICPTQALRLHDD